MTKSKSKKRKLAHAHSYNQNKSQHQSSANDSHNLSYEEIWDDSALVRSWNDAVAEYQFYHSIHARGEDVEKVLKQYHAANGGDRSDDQEEGEVDDDEDGEIVEDGELRGEVPVENSNNELLNISTQHRLDSASLINNDAKLQMTDTIVPTSTTKVELPTSPLKNTDDVAPVHHATTTTQSQSQLSLEAQNQTLENIKMAYYWAGYYSGLYDAQRQPQAPAESHNEGPNLP